MVKRLVWLSAGLGLGLWLRRRVQAQVARYAPEQVARRVTGTVRGLGQDLHAAVREGRTAMREREDSLRAQFRPTAR